MDVYHTRTSVVILTELLDPPQFVSLRTFLEHPMTTRMISRMRNGEDDVSARTTTTRRHNGKHNKNTMEEPHHLDPLRHQAEGDDGDLRFEGDDAEGVPSPFSNDMASLTEAVLRLVAQLHLALPTEARVPQL